ncbi:structural maintenance of chromosomes protein 4 [Cylas formicarius]|uniref:structural maintenance of chromosomes protein 4 n=1 Tax=Cylas formicarius TaxID=197179 RepID=UPI00295856AC|nr:structural maintenance of chromosomes protein 4 [Cylas formicarius]XP_060526996.1 structural maintenance of chromosomes protein 4 [Cylas formicarius]
MNTSRRKDADNDQVNESDNLDSDDELNFSDEDGLNVDGIYIPAPLKPTLSFDPTGPRLLITKITNNFFKSYANEQILGPFHKCFNAIVGPNGSGKSNVIDSLLFVFGYRATKIRCKKISVLLHNSENYRNVQSCTVAIHFALVIDKEGDKYDVVPGSEFVVSRTANKDNTSFYLLNGKRVQFKEVAILLKKHGIDLDHNRFLILQGEVEQISMMKCKADKEGESGMLEYLEDIIGTSRYKKALAQVNERVEILGDRRTEKLNRLKLVENEMEKLRSPMEEAVGFLKIENTVANCKNFLFQKNIFELNEKVEAQQMSMNDVLEEQKNYTEKLEKLSNLQNEKQQIMDNMARVCDTLKKKKDAFSVEFNQVEKRDVQLQEDGTNKSKKRKQTKELIIQEKNKLLQLEAVPEQNGKKIKEVEKNMMQAIENMKELEEEKDDLLKQFQIETKCLQEQKEEMQKEFAVLKEVVDKTKSAFNLAETELKVYINSEENEKSKLDSLKTLYETSQSTIRERSQEIATLKTKIPKTENSLKEATEELHLIKQEEAKLVQEIRSNRMSLEEGRSSMQASRSSGRVLDSLMQAKRDGKCPGLFGRLGDLGAIDQKYDVAVSTACGALDNIVVDTADCAQWCIEFLKKHDIGRAVFIALDKQEHLRQQANTPIQTPENVHRLFDLIKVSDERVRTAFYYGLRDTLVANDLDQASRIAYGARRYRVVTLKGDLIETTGTMSGGGKRMMRGKMGQSVAVSNIDPRDLDRLAANVQQMENHVRELRQQQVDLETQINTWQIELKQMKINLGKFTQELESLKQQEPNLARQLKNQEANANANKVDAAQVEKLTQLVKLKKQEYDTATETAGAFQVKVDKISGEIKDKSKGKIQVEKDIKECAKTIEGCKSNITKLKVAVKTAERNYAMTKDNIARMEQELEDLEKSLIQMKEERAELEEQGQKLLMAEKEITKELEDKKKDYIEIHKEVDDIKKKENTLKSEKIDIDEKLKIHRKKLDDYNTSIKAWQAKLGTLQLHDIPNETVPELEEFNPETIKEKNAEDIEKELQAAENHLKTVKPNLNAIEEYKKKREAYLDRTKELQQVTNKRTEMKNLYDKLRSQRKEEFMNGYNIIRLKLKEMYQMITLGGDAEFEMVDTYDPFTEGIQFNVRPPRKTWKKISNLSGGEKTLSSLALVFALHYYKPSPLYVMDEIDAALDFKNVSIVGNYIKARTKNAQFIIISLRSNMFELCDNLIGIYKTYNTTKTVCINPRLYENKNSTEGVQQNAAIDDDAVDVNMQGNLNSARPTEMTESNLSPRGDKTKTPTPVERNTALDEDLMFTTHLHENQSTTPPQRDESNTATTPDSFIAQTPEDSISSPSNSTIKNLFVSPTQERTPQTQSFQ